MIYEYEVKETKKVKIEINPCPFCGSNHLEPVHITGRHGYSSSKDYITKDYIKCLSCGAIGPKIKNNNGNNLFQDAVIYWNTRK